MARCLPKPWTAPQISRVPDASGIGLRALSIVSILAVYMQLFLGGAFRHGGMHFLPHLIGAGIAMLILSTIIIGVGTWLKSQGAGQ